MDAPLERRYGQPSDPSAMGLWFPTLAADAKLEVIVGPAPAGPGMGIWRGTVLGTGRGACSWWARRRRVGRGKR